MTALRSLYSIATPPSDVPGVQLGLDEVGDQHVMLCYVMYISFNN